MRVDTTVFNVFKTMQSERQRLVKVLQVINDYPPPLLGGGSYHVCNLTRHLVNEGVDVTVFTYKSRFLPNGETNTDTQCGGVRVRRVSAFRVPRTVYSISPELVPLLMKEDPDIIHAHGYQLFTSDGAAFVSMLRKKPFVLTLHGFPRDFEKLGHKTYFALIGKKTLEAAKRIISVSKIVALEFEAIGVPNRKIAIIPNGIDLKEFEQLPDGTRFRKRFSIEKGERMILAVGRLEKTKGFQHAIMAMAKLRCKYPVKLLIAGPNLDYGHQLKKIAKKAGVNDKVVFCGPINKQEKLEALAAADAVTIPSTYEGFGIFTLEALAARKPVVATRTGIASEVIRNGENGFLVNPGDPDDLTEKLAYLLDDRLSREMSNRSQEIIKAFDWKAITRQILSVYNECLEGSGS